MLQRVRRAVLFVPLLLGLSAGAFSCAFAADLRVHALFAGKAMFSLDGESFLLSEGETGPGGLRLISASSRSAVIEFGGMRRELGLERDRFAAGYATRAQPELRIAPGPTGSYAVTGLINGMAVRFVVDTGATLLTLSEAEASRLALSPSETRRIPVQTASGQVMGRQVVVDHLQLGGIEAHRVDAVVLPGEWPSVALLGMSVLSRIDMRNDGPVLVLQAR